MPASFIASRSRLMPCSLRFEPIHIHNTYGRAASGGFLKASNKSDDDEAAPSPCGNATEVCNQRGALASHTQNRRLVVAKPESNGMSVSCNQECIVHPKYLTRV